MSAPQIQYPPTSGGGAPVGGTGTTNTIPRWTGSSTLGDSLLTQSGATITQTGSVNGAVAFNVTNQNTGASAYSAVEIDSAGASWRLKSIRTAGMFAIERNGVVAVQIDNVLNVGIGTASPNKKFQVVDGASGEVRLTTTANVVGNTITQRFSSNAGAGAYEGGGAYIQAIQGSGIDVWSLAFGTANLSATATERARIDSSGNFGIGTSTMVAPGLTITDPTNVNNIARANLRNNNSDVGNRIATVGYNGNTIQLFTASESTGTANNTLAFFAYNLTAFYTGTTVANPQERMRIDSSGNVGIGTSPGYRLDVANSTASTFARIQTTFAASSAQLLLQGTAFGQVDNTVGDFFVTNSSAAGNLIFRTGSSTERMRVSASGTQAQSQVAIGTSTFTTGRALTTVADIDVFGVRVGRGPGSGAGTNTVVGNAALNANTTGTSNTAVGNFAANAVTTGASNTSIGFQANALLQGGSRNTAVGESAGYAALSSTDNTAIGRYAAVYNTGNNNVAVGAAALNGTLGSSTGGNNVAVGMQSGQAITTGTNNVFVGYVAGSGVTTGTSNTMIGYATASGGTTTGTDNTLVGAIAGNQITTGSNNVCVGSNAGQTQTSANDNTYVGKNAAYFQTGGSNTAVGRSALSGNTGSNGANNTAVGYQAGVAVTSGSSNVLLGWGSGNTLTTGSQNICIGVGAVTAAAGDNNQLVIGSTGNWVATPTSGTYHATAGASLGYIQVRLNGANVKIQVFAP